MNVDFLQLNWLAVAVVCVATFFLGGIWYSALGPVWVKLSRFTPDQLAAMKTSRPPPIFFGGMIASYAIFAVFLAILLRNLIITNFSTAAMAGALIWLAIAVPIALTNWLASDKQLGAYLIDLAFQFIFIVGSALILGLWR